MNLEKIARRTLATLCVSMMCLVAFAQDRQITGTVVDLAGEPIIGANVTVATTTNGTITDIDGNFSLQSVPSNAKIQISFIGYITQTITVGSQSKLKIKLVEDAQALDEVVVVGYGVQKKSDLTGSVGSVNSDNIVAKGATSVMESLQGQVAGVDISQTSSRAGDGFSISIRGKSSLAGGQPLYVIDGVVCDNMDFLNPSDIEKIDILKDASSTAIYGSRATNGVVMITTKQSPGSKGDARVQVSYDGYYGYKTVANMPDFMSGDEWTDYRFHRYTTLKSTDELGHPTYQMKDSDWKSFWGNGSPKMKEIFTNKSYYDWPDLVTTDGEQQNHFINIAGNANKISYRIGLGYQKEKGVMDDNYERWNVKAAIDHKINDRFSAGMTANMATALKDYGSQRAVENGFRANPYWVPYYWEGENAGELILQPAKDAAVFPDGGGFTSTLNPLVDKQNSKNETRTYDIMANLYLQYAPITDVILKTTFSPTYNTSKQGEFYGVNTETQYSSKHPDTGLPYNKATITNISRFSYTWDTQANYTKTFGDHSLNALLLFSMYSSTLEGDGVTANDMPFDVDWYNIGSAGFISSPSSYYKKISMLSYVARINYSYLGRYLATVSSRWDGSSKFQDGNRWGAFPSMALAWRISEEAFMKENAEWVSNLKARASYGLTGNNANVGPYDTQALAGTKYWYNFGSNPANGYGPNGIPNAALSWEKTSEINLGLDFGFLNGRISGSFDWYTKTSKDLLMDQLTPLELGSSTGAMINNVGKVKNSGIEISLKTVNVKTKNFSWETSFSFAKNKNKILELNGEKSDLVANKWFINQPIDVIYDYQYDGVCTQEEAKAYATNTAIKTKFIEGEMKLKDQQTPGEYGYGVIDENDLVVLGHALPDWTGSFNSSMYYKDFDFSLSIYTKQGGMVASPFMAEFTNYKDRGRNKIKMDYYIPAGTPMLKADGSGYTILEQAHVGAYPFPTNTAANNYGGGLGWGTDKQTTYVGNTYVDNSFVKIKNITMGYTFPKTWTSKIGVEYFRLYVNVLNPFTFTDYKGFDPEWADASISDGTGGPSSRTYQVGVNLKF